MQLEIPGPELPKLSNGEVRLLLKVQPQQLKGLFVSFDEGDNNAKAVRRSGLKLPVVAAGRKEWRLRKALARETAHKAAIQSVRKAAEDNEILDSPFNPVEVKRRAREERQQAEIESRQQRQAVLGSANIDPNTGLPRLKKKRRSDKEIMARLLRRAMKPEDRVEKLLTLADSENASAAKWAMQRIDEILESGQDVTKFPPMFMLPPDGIISVDRVGEIPLGGYSVTTSSTEASSQAPQPSPGPTAGDEDEASPVLTLPATAPQTDQSASTPPATD